MCAHLHTCIVSCLRVERTFDRDRPSDHHRSGKKLFKRFPLAQKARPPRQIGTSGTAGVHHTNRRHTNRHHTDRLHPNRTAHVGDTARSNATPAQLSVFSPTTLSDGQGTFDFFKRQNKPGHNNYSSDNPSIEEILRVLQRLEEDTRVETRRRRLRAGQIARPPWMKRPPPDVTMPRGNASKDIETPEKKPCIVSLEKIGMSLEKVGMPLGNIGTTAATTDALDLPTTAGATTTTIPTDRFRATSTTSALLARSIKMEEDSTEQAQQPRLGSSEGETAVAFGRNALSCGSSGKACDVYVSLKGAAVVGRRTPSCRPSVEDFDAVTVREAAAAAAMPPPSPRPPTKVSGTFAVKQSRGEGSDRLAWQRPPLLRTTETKPRRSASGPPCAGRVAHHRRLDGASKAERKRNDGRGKKGGTPKVKGGNGDLREAAGSVGALFVKGAPVSVAPVSVAPVLVSVFGGRCGRCDGECECCHPDAVGDLSGVSRKHATTATAAGKSCRRFRVVD